MRSTKRNLSNIFKILPVLFLAALLIPVGNPQVEGPPGTTLNLSENAGQSAHSMIVTSGLNVYVVWRDHPSFPLSPYDVLFRRNTDGGITFGPAVDLGDTVSNVPPRVAVSGQNVYVMWQSATLASSGEIFIRRSTDGGASFEPSINLSANSEHSSGPEIAVSGSNVYVVWSDYAPGPSRDIHLKRSANGGSSFGPTINLSQNSGDSAPPQIAALDTNVFVVWRDGTSGNSDILLRRSVDTGANFGPIVNLSSNNGQSHEPQIAALGSSVYVAWSDFTPGNQDIFLKRSVDNGASFSAVTNLSDNSDYSVTPKMAISGQNVHVLWTDSSGTPEVHRVRLRSSIDGGAVFSPTVVLGESQEGKPRPEMAVTNTNVYVAWTRVSNEENDEIFLRTSTDNGSSFGPAMNVSQSDGGSYEPWIVSTTSAVHMVWTDISYDTIPANTEIMYWSNRSPIMPPVIDRIVDEGILFTISATAYDPDNDPLLYTLGPSAPIGATISGEGLFAWTPAEADGPGTYSVTIAVSDGLLSVSDSVTITVREVNGPPVLATIGPKFATTGSSFTFTASGTDVDTPVNTLTFSCDGCASIGATMYPTGVFAWTPEENQGGRSYTVTITLSDGTLADTEDVVITVDVARSPSQPLWWEQYWFWIIILTVALVATLPISYFGLRRLQQDKPPAHTSYVVTQELRSSPSSMPPGFSPGPV